MNLEKLFETQKVLRNRINYQGEDRFNKLVLALLVELGECANEWRGFKFWSKDQKPREEIVVCSVCEQWLSDEAESCETCDYIGAPNEPTKKKPLLEEYVDGLHFILELGIELDKEKESQKLFGNYLWEEDKTTDEEIIKQFSNLYGYVNGLYDYDYYGNVLYTYFRLGEMLRFSWEQIEKAYYDKNSINHKRQDEGY
jgi:dimeric dUTPase (all-alpha-NTP-PPase superfamily)